MIKAPTPTRAEASDVATAIYDSADAVMLSAESASGDYPIEAVKTMDRIISHTETHRLYRSIIEALQPRPEHTVAHAVAAAAADIADQVDAVAIVAFTASGATAVRAARKRPRVPIVSISPEVSIARRMTLLWGTHSVVSRDVASYDEMVDSARSCVREEGFAKPGDTICVICGIPFAQRGSTNNVRVATA
jgi:pyruvate kinase